MTLTASGASSGFFMSGFDDTFGRVLVLRVRIRIGDGHRRGPCSARRLPKHLTLSASSVLGPSRSTPYANELTGDDAERKDVSGKRRPCLSCVAGEAGRCE